MSRPCFFVDRDGVLVDEAGYLARVEDMRVIPGALGLTHHIKHGMDSPSSSRRAPRINKRLLSDVVSLRVSEG